MKVLLADDHELILYGMSNILSRYSEVSEIFSAVNLYEVNDILEKNKIDFLFQDVRFGSTDARAFVKSLLEKHEDLKIIIITSILDFDMITTFLNQGVHGYILKIDCANELTEAIETVRNNKQYLSPKIQQYLKDSNKIYQQPIQLNDREVAVLKLILNEKTSKEIAQELYLSQKTIEKIRSDLYTKFEVSNLAGLVKKAILQGYR